MSVEKTLSIIKPDAVKRDLTGKIIAMFEEKGLRVVAQKKIWLSKEQAGSFYDIHRDRPFFANYVSSCLQAQSLSRFFKVTEP